MAEGAVAKMLTPETASELRLQLAHHREVGAVTLAPRLQDEAHEGANAVFGKPLMAKRFCFSGTSMKVFGQLVRIGREIVEVGVFRRIDEGEEHALVLGRRQLAVDGIVENAGQHDGQHRDPGKDRALLDRAVEAAAVEALQRAEDALDQAAEPARASACGFSIFDVIIGDSVNATTPDTMTAPASVKANSRNSAPVRPEVKPIGA